MCDVTELIGSILQCFNLLGQLCLLSLLLAEYFVDVSQGEFLLLAL